MQCSAETSTTVFPFVGGCGYFISWFGCNATTRSCRGSRSFQRKPKGQRRWKAHQRDHEVTGRGDSPNRLEVAAVLAGEGGQSALPSLAISDCLLLPSKLRDSFTPSVR